MARKVLGAGSASRPRRGRVADVPPDLEELAEDAATKAALWADKIAARLEVQQAENVAQQAEDTAREDYAAAQTAFNAAVALRLGQ